MICEYSKEVLKNLIQAIRKRQVALIKVQEINKDSYGIEYLFVDDYSGDVKGKIQNTLNKDFKKQVLAINVLDSFIKAMDENKVKTFDFSLSVICDDDLNYRLSYKCTYNFNNKVNNTLNTSESKSPNTEVINNTNIFDNLRTMFKDNNSRTLLYEKVGSGRQKKYVEKSIAEIIDILEELK